MSKGVTDGGKAMDLGKASLTMLVSLHGLAATTAVPIAALAIAPAVAHATEQAPPPLMLANVFDVSRVDVTMYHASEKLDGIRAYWTGRDLITRNGYRIHAPPWFTAGWPDVAFDGELWAGRNRFDAVTSTVRDVKPDDAAWRLVTFHVFDLPQHPGDFVDRTRARHQVVDRTRSKWLRSILHYDLTTPSMLDSLLNDIVAAGGEGLMLHRVDAAYSPGRSDNLLKLKPYRDDEARVVGYTDGKGKYQGKLGALRVQRDDGLEFLIGTGFSDAERTHPPAIGSYVTYAYQGLTSNGLPRFARFIRQHESP